jgi:iron complex outermembrane receptor protein
MRACVFRSCIALGALACSTAFADVLEEVVVTATLREQRLVEAPVSISVLDDAFVRDAGRQHFEDVLTAVPNLHWASGTSRPRFFLIRGIGEREQWEGAPNPSVGFLIDDIDFSGIGMAATTFDVDRIEVLRGPQGLRYGANALAGLILFKSRDPEPEFGFETAVSYGSYDSSSFGAVATGPAPALDSSWRIAVQRYRTDGFRENSYLGRDDTNGRDELTARAKWRWQPSAATTIDFVWLHADLDNNYDAWSIDNSRRSLADRPGKDTQRANAGAVRLLSSLANRGELFVAATHGKSQGEYSYDEDWGNPESWGPFTYDYFYRALSTRRATSFEARYTSGAAEKVGDIAWIAGAYVLDTSYDLRDGRTGVFVDPIYDYSSESNEFLSSNYDALNVALFGQLEGRWSERWSWSFGLRAEQRESDYADRGFDDDGPRAMSASQRDRMLGGELSLHYDVADDKRVFARLSRGYKAGGFNLGQGASLRPRFDPEYLWGFELGFKGEWLERRLYTDLTAFYMRREDMQVSTGIQEEGAAGGYWFITDNASRGTNAGLEATASWQLSEQIEIGGSLALLRTRYSGYRPMGEDVSDRDQAHAPEYQLSLHAVWRSPLGWMARVDFAAIDDYYFDVPPANQRADAYSLTHLKVGYESDRWGVYVWARNVFDEDYIVRGFYFANEPPDWQDKRYVQLGEPRQVGVSFRWQM